MKSNKKILVMVSVLLICLLGFMMRMEVNATSASDTPTTINPTMITTTGSVTANEQYVNEVYANSVYANEQAAAKKAAEGTVVQPATKTTNTTNETQKLPQTGVTEDITVMFFIIVCVVSAIYAYKKIKDYNV